MKSRAKPQNSGFILYTRFQSLAVRTISSEKFGLVDKSHLKPSRQGCTFSAARTLPQEARAADAIYRYDLLREKANLENPQIFQICKYKNNFSAEYVRVAAPCVCFVPWTALASYRPRPQQLLPVSAAGSGRRRCRANAAAIQNITPASFSAAVPQWASAGRQAAASAPWCMPA